MRKRSRAQIKKTIEAEIEERRKALEKTGHTFAGLSRKDLERKLRRAKSPFFDFHGWNNTAPHGGTIDVYVGVVNPDPVPWSLLAVHVFVGTRNPIVGNDEFLGGHDERFPTLTQPATVGFHLAPGASTQLDFSLRIPAGVEPTGYFANTALFQINFLDRGTFLDRGCVFFEVV